MHTLAAGQGSYEHRPLEFFKPHIPGIGAEEAKVLDTFLAWELRLTNYPDEDNAVSSAAYIRHGGEDRRMTLLDALDVSVQKPHTLALALKESSFDAENRASQAARYTQPKRDVDPNEVAAILEPYPTVVNCAFNPDTPKFELHAPHGFLQAVMTARKLRIQERISTEPKRSTTYENAAGQAVFSTHDLQLVGDARETVLEDPQYKTARHASEIVVGSGATIESRLASNQLITAFIGYLATFPVMRHETVQ